MHWLVVFFSVTFLMTPVINSQVLPPQYEFDVTVLDEDDDLRLRPMLDPDFEEDFREYCKCEDIDISHLDKEEEQG